jgi:hypothetical protein
MYFSRDQIRNSRSRLHLKEEKSMTEKRKFVEEESHFIPWLKREEWENELVALSTLMRNLREGLRPPASPEPFRAFAAAPFPFLVLGDSGLSWL